MTARPSDESVKAAMTVARALEVLNFEQAGWEHGSEPYNDLEGVIALVNRLAALPTVGAGVVDDAMVRRFVDAVNPVHFDLPAPYVIKKGLTAALIAAAPASPVRGECQHNYVQDDEHVLHRCCQKCGDVLPTPAAAVEGSEDA